ncbi:MAG: COG4315 family predicted lipoprotein [Actinomycetes bacterium]
MSDHVEMSRSHRQGRVPRRTRRLVAGPVAVAGAALILAACGSSTPAAGPSPVSTPTSSAAGATAAATVSTATTAYGTVLTAPSGQLLYGLTADTATSDACTGACLAIWPPLVVSGAPVAGSGVTGSLLGTLALPDGQHQVTYGGHPLYTFSGDQAAGQTKGQGLPFPAHASTPKGRWYLLATSGSFVTAAAGASASPSSSAGGGGNGY